MKAIKHNYHGQMLTTREIAELTGITLQALYSRKTANKGLTIAEAADMEVSPSGYRNKLVTHQVGELNLTLHEWSARFKVKYPTFIRWVADEDIETVVKRLLAGKKKPRKVQAKKRKKHLPPPDISGLMFNKDLELKRRIAGYRKQGTSDDVIYDRERRARYGNGR